MPPLYYSVRETDSYADVTLHADRGCPDGPVRAAPSQLDGDLCPECTDAEPEEPESPHPEGSPAAEGEPLPDVDQLLDEGVCPWCDDYEGEHVGQHASSAHPDDWAEYKA